jgi:hypothetical protein
MDSIKRIIELTDQIKDAAEHVKALEDERAVLEAQLIDRWAEDGIQSMRLDGRCVHMHVSTYANLPQGMEAAIDVLRQSDFADLVKPTVNRQSLGALVRELHQDGNLPPSFEGVIEVGHRPAIRVRKA